jgi:hypothetical protein
VQEICTLGLMRRGRETSLRFGSYRTPTGNVGASDRLNLRSLAPVLDPTTRRRPDATREAPTGIAVGITWQLARDRPGRVG